MSGNERGRKREHEAMEVRYRAITARRLANYAKREGWKEEPEERAEQPRWYSKRNGHAAIMVIENQTLGDYHTRMRENVKMLAREEARRPDRILAELTARDCDRMQIRGTGEQEKGTMPVGHALALIDAGSELLSAAITDTSWELGIDEGRELAKGIGLADLGQESQSVTFEIPAQRESRSGMKIAETLIRGLEKAKEGAEGKNLRMVAYNAAVQRLVEHTGGVVITVKWSLDDDDAPPTWEMSYGKEAHAKGEGEGHEGDRGAKQGRR